MDVAVLEPGRVDRRQPVRQQVCDLLREAIIQVHLPPGQALSEADIAHRLGIARSSSREALLLLSEEGFVEIFPQVGTFVSRLKADEVLEALFVREALECRAVRAVAGTLARTSLVALERNLDDQRAAVAAEDFDELYRLDERLHRTIAEATGFPRVWRLVRGTRAHTARIRNLTIPHRKLDGPRTAISFHAAIVGALVAGDGAAAEHAMRRHMQANLSHARQLMEEFPDFVDAGP